MATCSHKTGNAKRSLERLWAAHTPPENVEEVFDDVHRAICRSMVETCCQDRKGPRRGAAQMANQLEHSALLVVATQPKLWLDARSLGLSDCPADHRLRCLWLLAAAWRFVRWLDSAAQDANGGTFSNPPDRSTPPFWLGLPTSQTRGCTQSWLQSSSKVGLNRTRSPYRSRKIGRAHV